VEHPERVLKLVADERLRVPHGGTAWHWVSYYSTEKFVSLQENMKIVPNIVFNYLGETKLETQNQPRMFREIYKPADKVAEYVYNVTEKSPHTCKTIVDAGQFKVYWEYFPALDEQSTIENLIREYLTILRSLIRMAG
jgi:non-ribosomal peptide synthase protein (TIGR01720 family)